MAITFDGTTGITAPAVTTTGNISGDYLLGNGALITGLPAGYSNADVGTYLASNSAVTILTTSNITTAGNIVASYVLPRSNAATDLGAPTLQWRSLYVSNNTIYIGGVSVGVSGNSLTVGNSTVVTEGTPLTGNIDTAGNISAGNISVTGVLNVTNDTSTFKDVSIQGQILNDLAVQGNVNSGNLNISQDAVILGNLRVQGNTTYINVSDLIVEDKDIIVGANASATLSDLNGAGLQIGNISAGGNITFFYDSTSNSMVLSHGANISNTVGVTGNIDASGNISGQYLLGNGSQLTGISAGAVISDDTSTNSNYYPVFATATSGSLTTATISSTKLTFNPSSGTLTAVDVNTSSDLALKENVDIIDSAMDLINSIKGVSFNWSDTKKKSYGVIAQDLEKTLPELVGEGTRGKTVSYLPLIAILIQAVKEQQQQIQQLMKK